MALTAPSRVFASRRHCATHQRIGVPLGLERCQTNFCRHRRAIQGGSPREDPTRSWPPCRTSRRSWTQSIDEARNRLSKFASSARKAEVMLSRLGSHRGAECPGASLCRAASRAVSCPPRREAVPKYPAAAASTSVRCAAPRTSQLPQHAPRARASSRRSQFQRGAHARRGRDVDFRGGRRRATGEVWCGISPNAARLLLLRQLRAAHVAPSRCIRPVAAGRLGRGPLPAAGHVGPGRGAGAGGPWTRPAGAFST